MKKKILVTGGLGYIGSHTIVELINEGYHPIVVDNLSNSYISVLDGLKKICNTDIEFHELDVRDTLALESIFEKNKIDSVIHFAAYKAVGESVKEPLKYYNNNIGGLISLLQVMQNHQCNQLVFSSSCTVYGQPETLPVTENESIKKANSPYGNTKQIGEEILEENSWLKTISLRYFNPIGAHHSALIGELPIGIPNNLVPYITQTAAGIREALTIFGNTYNTPDGTCIRDYIHVVDLAKAHVKALNYFNQYFHFETFNIGTGKGYSVKEIVDSFEKTNNLKLNVIWGDKREGDVEQVWADATKSNEILGWKAQLNLNDMLLSSWHWQKRLSDVNSQ